MNISGIRSVYMVGIKGAGMTALAQVLAGRGVHVSGSDTIQHFYTDDVLRRAGIPFVEEFSAENVPRDTDLVIRSTAYDEDHVEVAEATRRGLETVTYPETLAAIFNAGRGVAVCGTHGKSTTTAMLGYVLAEAGLDPTVVVGAEVPQFGGNARVGRSDLIVLEADEYQDKLRFLKPHGVVLTSVEWDHPDFFTTPEAYADAFRRFVARIPPDGFLVACADDPAVMEIVKAARCIIIPYGLRKNYSPIRTNRRIDGGAGNVKNDFSPSESEGSACPPLAGEGADAVGLVLQLLGRHNIQNALGVLAVTERLGVPHETALSAVSRFQGTRRRFEIIGIVQPRGLDNRNIVVIDDYGHHPTEIRVTLAAARERYPGRRILCAFHAHTFTRTIALLDQFATAFANTDCTYVMDVFGSAREFTPSSSPSSRGGARVGAHREDVEPAHGMAERLAEVINQHSPAVASGGVGETIAALARDVRPGDVVLCMGAGENDRVARGLVERLRARVERVS